MTEVEQLKALNAQLNDQLRLFVRTDQRLQQAQNNLERQLRRIRQLNELSLAVMQTSSSDTIIDRAFETLMEVWATQCAIAIVDLGHPVAHVLVLDEVVQQIAVPPDVLACLRDRSPDRAARVDDSQAAIVGWLGVLTDAIEEERRGFAAYRRSDAITPIGAGVLLMRTARIGPLEQIIEDSDLPFLDVLAKHVSTSLERARLHATLEQRVASRTEDLMASLESLQNTQAQLVEASRRAGMSDVASSVLHNVGNVLNSVNVSASLVEQGLGTRRTKHVAKVAALLAENANDLPGFFATDRGKRIPEYVAKLAMALDAEDSKLVEEIASVRRNVDHIKAVIMLQQDFARTGQGALESISLSDVIDDALRIEADACERHEIVVSRPTDRLPTVTTDRHKVLQILTNLLANARHAVENNPLEQRQIAVIARLDPQAFVIDVVDKGVGISPDNLERIFNLGFTTKPKGHGYGLHSSACSAEELGGRLTCHSDGPGHGAKFTLAVPLRKDAA